jgi:hypothetical protein
MDIEQLKKEMIGEFAEIVKVHNDLNPNFNITIPAFEHIESFLLFKFNELEKAMREEIEKECLESLPKENGVDVDLGYNDWLPYIREKLSALTK